MVTRVCSKCGLEKETCEFYKHHPHMCRKCFSEYQRSYYRRVHGLDADAPMRARSMPRKVEPEGECCGTCKSYSKSSGGLTMNGGWCMAHRRSTHSFDTCERWREVKNPEGRYEELAKPIPTYRPNWE